MANEGFRVQEGPGIFSPRIMLESPRASPGIANPSGELAFMSVAQWSFEDREMAETIHIFSLDSDIPATTIEGSAAFWFDSRTLVRVLDTDGVQVLEAFTINGEGNKFVVSEPQDHVALPPGVSAANFVYSDEARILVFSASVYDDYDLKTVKMQDEAWEGRETTAYVFDETFVRNWDIYEGPKRSRLFGVDLKQIEGRLILGNEFYRPLLNTKHYTPVYPFGGADNFAVSKSHIAYTTKDPSLPQGMHTRQPVYLVPIKGKEEPKELTAGTQGATMGIAFSRTGDKVAWLELGLDGYDCDKAEVVVYDLIQDVRFKVCPEWDRLLSGLSFSADDRQLILLAGETGRTKVFAVDLPPVPRSKHVEDGYARVDPQYHSEPVALIHEHNSALPQSLPGGRILFSQSSHIHPNELFLLSNSDLQPKIKRISHFSDAHLGGLGLALAEDIWFKGANNTMVHGFVLKPRGWEKGQVKNYPAMLWIHGGPQDAWLDGWSFRANPNVFAHQGYFVILINEAGSTTYGQDFTDAATEDWGGRPFIDLQRGWKHALATYVEIDADRTVAFGGSWGGFAINWINCHPEYDFGFKALACHDGVFDTWHLALTTDVLYFMTHQFGGVPWQTKLHEKFNPSLFTGKMNTPTLFIHSRKDYRAPETQGLAGFHALQMKGVPSRLLYYPDETHFVSRPGNSLKWHYEVLRWFDAFVGWA